MDDSNVTPAQFDETTKKAYKLRSKKAAKPPRVTAAMRRKQHNNNVLRATNSGEPKKA